LAYRFARSSSSSIDAAGVFFSAARIFSLNHAFDSSGATLRNTVATFGGDLRTPSSNSAKAWSGALP
jgi:hypothetical protein